VNRHSVVGSCDCTRAGFLLLFLITFSNVAYFIFVLITLIFVARNGLGLPNPCTHDQRRIIAVRAPLALRKPLQQQPRATTTITKLKRPTYMKRAHDARVAEAPPWCARTAQSQARAARLHAGRGRV
jgi:hypothetical protein